VASLKCASSSAEIVESLLAVPVVDVAKIAAILINSCKEDPRRSAEAAYKILEMVLIARLGISQGVGTNHILADNANFPEKYPTSIWRLEELRNVFPEIHSDGYIVPFDEGLSKLMGRNIEAVERPNILRKFLFANPRIWLEKETASETEVQVMVDSLTADGFRAVDYISLWRSFPEWRERDKSSVKAKNAVAKRGARLSELNKNQEGSLLAMRIQKEEAKKSKKQTVAP
jgi:hypothetical protein